MGRLIITSVRNEAPFLLEWLAWHRHVGFDQFLIYSNDCTDGTDRMLARLDALGLISWQPNDGAHDGKPQTVALNRAVAHPLYRGAEWALHIDADEFVMVRCGQGRLDDLLAAVPEANMISLSWRNFGASGVKTYSPGLLTQTFTWCSPRYLLQPWQLTGIKTLHRPLGHWGRIGPHRPFRLQTDKRNINWVGGSGQPYPERFLVRGWRVEPGHFGDALAQINHYPLKSQESFLVKCDRGYAQKTDAKLGYAYWCLRNINFEQDHEIDPYLPHLHAARTALLADPELRALQQQAEDWHRAKAQSLKETEEGKGLWAAIDSYKPTGSYTLTQSAGRDVYAFTMPEVPDQLEQR